MTTLKLASSPSEQDQADVSTLLDNPDWQPFRGDFQKIRSFLPNRMYHNKVTRTAAIVIGRAAGGDFALSQLALRFVVDALKAGKLGAAYVALRERDGDEVLAFKPIIDVETNVSGSTPIDGINGRYWWLDTSFQITERQAPRSQNTDWM